ncbi:MAG: CPBP family glutamic-type intramembrane protease [Lactococcus lactis]|nr:CPBP family glutamic-type intramembrane protease [Lactococcus lactis]
MKKLFTAPMSKSAVPLSLILLLAGFLALSFGLPVIAPFSLAIAGFISLYILFGKKGISYTFSKPQKIVSTYFAGLIGAYIFAGVGILITKILLGSSPNSNPVADGMTIFGLLKTIPMLLGEELITIILLIIIANLLGGTRKALIVAVIISTLIFGFLHLPTYDWNFAQVIFIIAAARIPFTLASLKSDSLYTGLLIHITYDWIIFILVILSHH